MVEKWYRWWILSVDILVYNIKNIVPVPQYGGISNYGRE